MFTCRIGCCTELYGEGKFDVAVKEGVEICKGRGGMVELPCSNEVKFVEVGECKERVILGVSDAEYRTEGEVDGSQLFASPHNTVQSSRSDRDLGHIDNLHLEVYSNGLLEQIVIQLRVEFST